MDEPISYRIKANPKDVKELIKLAPSEDTRSEWEWLTLSNGDLVLAVFPTGDTYERITQTVFK